MELSPPQQPQAAANVRRPPRDRESTLRVRHMSARHGTNRGRNADITIGRTPRVNFGRILRDDRERSTAERIEQRSQTRDNIGNPHHGRLPFSRRRQPILARSESYERLLTLQLALRHFHRLRQSQIQNERSESETNHRSNN